MKKNLPNDRVFHRSKVWSDEVGTSQQITDRIFAAFDFKD
jgi:hypothetical protein